MSSYLDRPLRPLADALCDLIALREIELSRTPNAAERQRIEEVIARLRSELRRAG